MNTHEFDSLFRSLFGEERRPEQPEEAPSVPKRLAFADLVFSWPPNGGADVELYNVIMGLQELGHEVRLFVAHEEGSFERGLVTPQAMPFPVTVLDFTPRRLAPEYLVPRFQNAIGMWQPDAVFLTHGFALKPYLAAGLREYRLAARYYAHELACARDPRRFKDGAPCPNDYFRTPEQCRRCALEGQRQAIEHGRGRTWTADWLAARAYTPEYHTVMRQSLEAMDAILVNNTGIAAHLDGLHPNVYVVPPGVHSDTIAAEPPPEGASARRKVVLMPGRADDPLKGLPVLMEAGRRLARTRNDFEIWATHFDYTRSSGWFRALGWRDHAAAMRLYSQCAICVAPAVWEEPFGLVAVEAMAAARPVVASNCGGLRETVRDGETGFLFAPGDAEALADRLTALLDNAPLRRRMGAAGRRIVEQEYDWNVIIKQRYQPLIEVLTA